MVVNSETLEKSATVIQEHMGFNMIFLRVAVYKEATELNFLVIKWNT
jgi:hypothetical protein